MPAAFTDSEREQIISALREAAFRHAQTEGMKKTSVDMLAAEAGISKGAFYHFYAVKELLFLDMLENWHESIARHAEQAFLAHTELPIAQRAAITLQQAIR